MLWFDYHFVGIASDGNDSDCEETVGLVGGLELVSFRLKQVQLFNHLTCVQPSVYGHFTELHAFKQAASCFSLLSELLIPTTTQECEDDTDGFIDDVDLVFEFERL